MLTPSGAKTAGGLETEPARHHGAVTITIYIDSRLRVSVDELGADTAGEVESLFEHVNPAYQKAMAMGYRYTKEPRKYVTWEREQDRDGAWWLSLPRGGMQRLLDVLDAHGREVEFIDDRAFGDESLGSYTGDWVTPQIFPPFTRALWEHQHRVKAAILGHENCIVRSPTGSGKTTALLAAIAEANVPAIVVMNDGKLLKQWQERARDELGIPIKAQGLIQGRTRRLKPLTLAMQQSLWKFSPDELAALGRRFGFFGLDECQFTAAKTVLGVVDPFACRYKVGVSADETRKDGKDFLTRDMFGEVAVEISKQELVDKGIIHDVSVRVMPTDFEAEWYTRAAPGDKNFNELLDAMTKDGHRNNLVRRVVEGIVRERQPSLVFSHRVEHCRALDAAFTGDGHPTGLLLGGDDFADEFAITKQAILDGDKLVGVGTYKAIGTGQDIANVVNGVAATPIHTNRQFLNQVKGRICRKSEGKTAARLYYLWDRHVFGAQAVRALMRWTRDVRVWDGNSWADAREYLKGKHGKATKISGGAFASADDYR